MNSLYPFSLAQEMPCGIFVRRDKMNNYRPVVQRKYLDMYIWMDRISELRGITINYKLNSGKEHYIKGFYVDGICRNEIFEYNSCFYHGCQKCFEKEQINKSERWKRTQRIRYQRTVLRNFFLEKQGFTVQDIWECDFQKQFRHSTQHLRNRYLPRYYQKHKGKVSKENILRAIENGSLFGMAEVDIHVPQTWSNDFHYELQPQKYFEELSPLFCTTQVHMDVIREHMIKHMTDFQLSLRPRKLLVGGVKASKIMLSTPLLQ